MHIIGPEAGLVQMCESKGRSMKTRWMEEKVSNASQSITHACMQASYIIISELELASMHETHLFRIAKTG